jgi:hypothetical protein
MDKADKTETSGSRDSTPVAQNGAIWENSVEKYPRKQMIRDRWMSLNGPWNFAFDQKLQCNTPPDVPTWTHQIQVPFAPESELSGIGDTGFHPRCWYQKKFDFKKTTGKRYLLHFGAVDYEARVWLNGNFLGCHLGGHTPFSFDITHLLTEGDQILSVCADDDPLDLAKPRGKQDWQLDAHLIWYPRTTGIWQSVWIEEVPMVYIDRLRWTPLLERWEIGCEAFVIGNPCDGMQLRVRLSAHGRLLADDIYTVIHNEVHRRIALSDPGIDDFRNELLWSPEKPTLIDAEIELIDGGKVIDRLKSYTALRSVSTQRGRFLLNGRPYYLRMILNQGYWAESLMTAPTPESLKKDVELIKASGFNGVRMHQKIEDPDFLYWADRLGLIVWGEMPSAYRFTHESVERLMKEWAEVIDRDSNHPCVCVWVPFNESWGVPDVAEKGAHQSCVQAMYHLTRTLDPTRPVIGNDGWESTATDIMGIHDYDDQPERLVHKYAAESNVNDILSRRWPGGRMLTVEGYPHRGQPIMLTEFGGIACMPVSEKEKRNWGYSVCTNGEDFQKRYVKLLDAVNRIEIFSGFCYTQFTDTFQEANGLFTIDRKPKFSLSAMTRATRHNDQTRGELTSSPMPPPLPLDQLDQPPEENLDLPLPHH